MQKPCGSYMAGTQSGPEITTAGLRAVIEAP
jgi:hypothetical protein